MFTSVQFSSVALSSLTLRPHESQHARPPCPSATPRDYSNSCPSSRWCHPDISSSVVPFSSCPQSLPASGSFPMSQPFAWGGQSIGVSASASVLPTNTQDWSPLGWTGWISLQSKGLWRVFSNTTVQKHQFFGAQLSSQSNSHIHTWPLEKTIDLTRRTFVGNVMLFHMLSSLVITFLPILYVIGTQIMIHNFEKLFSIYYYEKMLAVFPVCSTIYPYFTPDLYFILILILSLFYT